MSDLLTGLASRHELHLLLPELAARATMTAPLSLLLLKISGFSLWQGRLTPLAADRLLSEAAGLLREHAPKQSVTARWGGATFALALPACPSWQAEEWAEGLRTAAAQAALPAIFTYEGFNLDFHYGCGTLPPDDIWRLAPAAEAALKRAEGGAFTALAENSGPPAEQEALLKLARGFLAASGPYLPRLSSLTSSLALTVARRMGLNADELAELELAAAFADIALAELAGPALVKPGPLREQEWRKIQRHAMFAARLTESLGLSRAVTEAVLYHHERHDGLGYPEGLTGADIPLLAAILHGATTYAALLLPRPYRPARRPFAARAELSLMNGKDIAPEVVKELMLIDSSAAATLPLP